MPNAPRQHRPAGIPVKRDNRTHTATDRGYDHSWYKHSRYELCEIVVDSADPWCVYCRLRLATMMDHAIPPIRLYVVGSEGYLTLFNNRLLWMPSCRKCNTIKGSKLPNELDAVMRQRLTATLLTRGVTDAMAEALTCDRRDGQRG